MKSCLVCGNGPSLADIRNDTLAQIPTFGGNRVYLKFEPTYYVFVDPMMGRRNATFIDEINSLTCEKFIVDEFAPQIKDCHALKCEHRIGFSSRPLEFVYAYFSVVTVMIQLAFWKGFDRVGIVGLDHRYNEPRGSRAWHPASEDTNHFIHGYYDGYLAAWKAPRLDKLEDWFRLAKTVAEADGRLIENLTPNSGLNVFPKTDLDVWLGGVE